MSTPLLVEYFNQLQDRGTKQKAEAATAGCRQRVSERYSEGTLLRLLANGDARTRRAALLALGMVGTMAANEALAARLHDEEAAVRQGAVDALWALWFRADTDEN